LINPTKRDGSESAALGRELKGKLPSLRRDRLQTSANDGFGEGYGRLPSLALAAESPEGAPGKLVLTIGAPLGPWQLGDL